MVLIGITQSESVPEWLGDLHDDKAPSQLPLRDLIENSLYYPSSGLNGTPVKYLAGFVHSFIYVDYGISKKEFLANLNGSGPDCGFYGYEAVFQKSLDVGDVVPTGWTPPIVPKDRVAVERLRRAEESCRQFGHWSVWRRKPSFTKEHGSEMFSFMFFAGESSAIYQGLYNRLGIAPKILAVIQPGSMGGEWESITKDDSFFKRVVRENEEGLPGFLLYGGFGGSHFYEEPCWHEYSGERLVRLPERYAGLWRLSGG